MIKLLQLFAFTALMTPYPVFSNDMTGSWNFFHGGDKSTVTITEGSGKKHNIHRTYSDGSENTIEATIKQDGQDVIFDEDDTSEFWVLKLDGSLEFHDRAGLLPGWKSVPSDFAGNDCTILNVDEKQSVVMDDNQKAFKANTIEVRVSSNFIDKEKFIASARSVLEKLAKQQNAVLAEIWYYRLDNDTGRDHEFYAAYTPDPSKLAFREKAWDSPNTHRKDDLWKVISPADLCK